MKKILILFFLLFFPFLCFCQKSIGLVFEEDFFWEFFKPSKNLDKDYTGGGALIFKRPFVQKARLTTLNKWIDKATRLHRLQNNYTDAYEETFRIGLTVFTPEGKYLDIATPLYGQRPYASIVFAGTTRNFLNSKKRTALITQFDIGVLGLYAARESQAFIHRIYKQVSGLADSARPYDPVGWHNQVSDGGEPTFLYAVTFKKLLTPVLVSDHAHYFDATVSAGGSIGFTNAITGSINARLGLIRSGWEQFNSFPIPEAFDSVRPERKGLFRNTEIYLFATVRPGLMIYSVPLQGQFRHSEVSFSSGEVNHLLAQAEAGVTISFLKWITLNGIFIYRTRQYKTIYGKEHSYFSLGISVRSPFK